MAKARTTGNESQDTGKRRPGERDSIYRRPGSKIWYVRIRTGGQDYRQSTGSTDRKDAQELLGRLRAQAAREQLGLAREARHAPTLTEYKVTYLKWAKAHKRSAERDERSIRELEPYFGDTRLSKITRAQVVAYQQVRLDTGVKGATVNREVACLRKILSNAVDAGKIEVNPLLRFKMLPESPGRIPVLEPADEERLLEALIAWMRPLVRLAVATGARQGELLALRWRDVDMGTRSITITDSKSGDSRRIPLHPALLDDLRHRRGTPEGFVVTLPDGGPPARQSVASAFKDAARAIGRGELRFHDLRHVAGSRLLATGASLPEVASMLGHKTLAMSKRYSHVSPVRLAGLIAAMPVVDAIDDPNPPRRRRRSV